MPAAANPLVLLTYAAPALLATVLLVATGSRSPTGRTSGFPSGRVVLAGVGALGVLRLVVQALDGGLRFGLGLTAAALAVAVLTLTVAFVAARPNGGHQAALGLTLGVGLSVGLQLALGTWDAYWRHTPLGWTVTVVLVVGAILLARLVSAEVVGGRPHLLKREDVEVVVVAPVGEEVYDPARSARVVASVEAGSPDQIFNAPSHPRTAEFLAKVL